MSTLDDARELLASTAGPAIMVLVAADLATAEYGDIEQAAEELAGALDLLDLEAIPPYRTDQLAADVVDAIRFLEVRSAEVSPTELGACRVVEHQLEELLTYVVRRHP